MTVRELQSVIPNTVNVTYCRMGTQVNIYQYDMTANNPRPFINPLMDAQVIRISPIQYGELRVDLM